MNDFDERKVRDDSNFVILNYSNKTDAVEMVIFCL